MSTGSSARKICTPVGIIGPPRAREPPMEQSAVEPVLHDDPRTASEHRHAAARTGRPTLLPDARRARAQRRSPSSPTAASANAAEALSRAPGELRLPPSQRRLRDSVLACEHGRREPARLPRRNQLTPLRRILSRLHAHHHEASPPPAEERGSHSAYAFDGWRPPHDPRAGSFRRRQGPRRDVLRGTHDPPESLPGGMTPPRGCAHRCGLVVEDLVLRQQLLFCAAQRRPRSGPSTERSGDGCHAFDGAVAP